MKLVSAASILISSTMADKWSQLGDLWSGLSQSGNVADDDRKIMELFTISSIANYGCWCRFNMYKPYKGTAQDTVDEACEQWHKNYDCLHVDYSTNTPFFRCGEDTQYVDVITQVSQPFDPATDYETQCTTANPGDNCAIQACHVDAVFIRHVVNFLSASTLNMTLSGWYGFDGSACRGATVAGTTAAPGVATTGAPAVVTTDPAATTATPMPTIDCCGSYPARFPYKLNNGNRACCVDTTYNVNILECCPATNILNLIGTC